MADVKSFRFKKAHIGKFESINANLALIDFKPGCRIMGLTRGNFSLIDLIHAVLKKTGPAKGICTTWSAGIKDVHNVKWMIGSSLIQQFTLVTDYTYSKFSNKKDYALTCEELFGKENIYTTNIHAKFVLIENKEYKVCIRTSMNLNANKKCENFELDENPEIYDFYYNFVSFIQETQTEGFVTESRKVNKTLDLFFSKQKEDKIKGWNEF
jgi:hypothetical protein